MGDEDRQYALEAFRSWVRSGYSGDEILREIEDRLGDLLGREDPALLAEVEEQVRRDLAAQRAREATWDEETVNDRIDEAFDELTDSGIVALQNAGYTMSDGW